MIIDTHTHTYLPGLRERGVEVLANMRDREVELALQIGIDVDTSREAVRLAREHREYRAVVGMHPCDAQSVERDGIDRVMADLEEIIVRNRPYVVAVGETGLDYHYPNTLEKERRTQWEFFRQHVELAKKYDLPLVLHIRDAWEDAFRAIEEFRIERAVFHCYTDTAETAKRIVELVPDGHFGLGGAVTYKANSALREAVAAMPLDRILLETDAPFMTPVPLRGRENEPSFIRHTFDVVASVLGGHPTDLERTIYENSRKFFRL